MYLINYSVYDDIVLFHNPHLCLKKIIFFLNSVENKNSVSIFFHIFMGQFIVYFIKKYSLQEDIFNHI